MRSRFRTHSFSLALLPIAIVGCTSLLGDFEVAEKTEQPATDAATDTTTPEDGGPGVDAADAAPRDFTAISVAAGESHTCAVRTPGNVYCWGKNDRGQLGVPPNSTPGQKSNRPVKVPNLGAGVAQGKAIVKVFVGGSHTCALDLADSLFCWGGNDANQLNNGAPIDANAHPEPKPVKPQTGAPGMELTGVTHVSLGITNSCVVLASGDTLCWGNNIDGQNGNPTRVTGQAATKVPLLPPAKMVSAGFQHACVLTTASQIWCWGTNSGGQLGPPGDAGLNAIIAPRTIDVGATPFYVTSGGRHTCVLAGSPLKVQCIGENTVGQLGIPVGSPNNTSFSPIVEPANTPQPEAIDVGGAVSCARSAKPTPALGCWGANGQGQLGLGVKDAVPHSQITRVDLPPLSENEGSFSVGITHICAIAKSDALFGGVVYCWGQGNFGKLGVDPANIDDSPIPKPVILPD